MENVVSLEVAQQEVNKWLDSKKIKEKARETHSESIESLVSSVADSTLILNDDNSFCHKLNFQVLSESGEPILSELVYKNRLTVGEVNMANKGVAHNDVDGRILTYMSVLTNTPKGKLMKLDTQDYAVARSIVVFFL
ncbi:MAG: phage tail assembly protein [Taibaiella sp.]|nr:phage tail assembly protein [Taibaiella sp.]